MKRPLAAGFACCSTHTRVPGAEMMPPHLPAPGFLVPSLQPAFSGQGAPDSAALSHVSEILQVRGAVAAFTCHPGTLPEPGPDEKRGEYISARETPGRFKAERTSGSPSIRPWDSHHPTEGSQLHKGTRLSLSPPPAPELILVHSWHPIAA